MGQGLICGEAEPFCAGDSQLIFPNSHSGTPGASASAAVGIDYSCSGTAGSNPSDWPFPAWYFLRVGATGDLIFTISQTQNADGSGIELDVDFMCWGPFNSSNIECAFDLTAANKVDCSWLPSTSETMTINSAIAGETYVVMITNFSQQAGFISLQQTNSGDLNSGSTDCSIVNATEHCIGDILSLDATTGNAVRYEWEREGELLDETGAILNNVTAPNANYIVRAYNSSDTLLTTIEFNLIFYETPTSNLIPNQLICDDNNDGSWDFDFSALDVVALGGQSAADYTVSYHLTQTDSDEGTNVIVFPFTNTTAYTQEEIYVRVENNLSSSCYDTSTSFLINIFDSPVANMVTYELCDNDLDGFDTNGIVEFDLSTKIDEVLGIQLAADFEVKFYYSQADADDAVVGTDITGPIENTTNLQTIVARIEHRENALCYATTTFNLVVNPLPVVSTVVELTQCDTDTDGFSDFNLTEANVLISNNSANEFFTYYSNDALAISGLRADQIDDFTGYRNPTETNSVVYARVETINGCFRTARIDLVVGTTNIPLDFSLSYSVCDDKQVDGDNTNGVAAFDFSNATASVLNELPTRQNLTITYYTNEADALAETNAIADISNHRNETSSNTQNIYVRVDSDVVNACLGLGHHITLTVNPLPIANPITDYTLCSDTDQAVFDLTTKNLEVLGFQTRPILISYHLTEQDAKDNIVIPNANNYTNINNSQTIFVRSQFDDNDNGIGDDGECYNTDMSFKLNVNYNPVIFTPEAIRICSDQIITGYDLTIREVEITGGDTSIGLSYFESQQELDNDNPITDPSSYTNTILDREILVLATGTNLCTTTISLTLKTILYANINITPTTIEECEIDNNGFDYFDITRRELEILNNLDAAEFTFTYYEYEGDAIAGSTNAIVSPTNFENTQINTQTIYVRVLPIDNECFIVLPLTLIVNPVPEIDIEDQYVICLDNTEAVINPGIATFLPVPPIYTQLDVTQYSFQWYHGTEAAVNTDPSAVIITGATGARYVPIAAGDYTVIATNIATGCRIPASTVVVGSYPPERITVELVSPAFSGNNILEVTVIGVGDYEYRLDDGLWQTTPRFEQVTGGEHVVYVRDVLNCNVISVIKIVIDYPKYFTPNGDGYHDTWNIRGIATQPNSKIYIFDRYGKLLKQLSPIGDGWDGTYNGYDLPSSDYWFTVEYIEPRNKILKQFKAHFTLKR